MPIIKNKKPTAPELEERVASQMLDNIFDACNVQPNHVPLSVLTTYKNYQKDRYMMQKCIVTFFIMFFFLFLLLFTTPNIEINMPEVENKNHPVYQIDINTIIPVSNVTAVIDGNNVPVYKIAEKSYSIEPALNGEMTVTVSLTNKQSSQAVIEVTGVDITPPVFIADSRENDTIVLSVIDDWSGVDYPNIMGYDLEGNEVPPASYDENKGFVVFKYPETSLNIFIPDKAENTLHLILTIQSTQ